jgi:hypothetical protein
VVFYTNNCLIIYTGYNLRNTRQDGGNDEKEPKRCQTRVVWAIGEVFFLFLRFSILTTGLLYIKVIIYMIHDGMGVGWLQRRQRAQTTPDARCLGHRCVFFFFFFVFLYTNISFIIHTGYNLRNTRQDGDNDEKEPKRRQTRVVWAILVLIFAYDTDPHNSLARDNGTRQQDPPSLQTGRRRVHRQVDDE